MSIITVAKPALPPRKTRSPKHPFRLEHKPWQLQPFMCAPVLPGETMTNLLFQSRAVSSPILDPICGWWLEYYFFYVKLTDLDARDDLTEMIIDPENLDVSALKLSAVEQWSYTAEGGIPWSKLCLKRVVEEFFRNEGETWNTAAIDSVPLVATMDDRSNWAQSLVMTDDLDAIDVDLTVGVDDVIAMSEVEDAMRQYELLKMHGLTKMSWSDYLEAQGVRTAAAVEPHRPELLRHVREWTYPTNTIDPADGTPRSAVSWAVAERGDKFRAFSEPGFILGVTCARPKIYLRQQVGSAAGFMASSAMWMPIANADDPWSSLQKHVVASGSGPVPTIADANGYVWDMRDLLMYGEQFVNFDPAAKAASSLVDLPTTTGGQDYVDADDITSLFVGSSQIIKQDGVVHLSIKSRNATDMTPGPRVAVG